MRHPESSSRRQELHAKTTHASANPQLTIPPARCEAERKAKQRTRRHADEPKRPRSEAQQKRGRAPSGSRSSATEQSRHGSFTSPDSTASIPHAVSAHGAASAISASSTRGTRDPSSALRVWQHATEPTRHGSIASMYLFARVRLAIGARSAASANSASRTYDLGQSASRAYACQRSHLIL